MARRALTLSSRRPRLIVGNWKMHKTATEARGFVAQLAALLPQSLPADVTPANATIVLAPPFTAISAVADAITSLPISLSAQPISLSAQDVHWEDHGAFTGEVSAPMLKHAGCHYVLIGHSERRQLFGETNAVVNKKMAAALRHGLRPILCIGETWEQRSGGQARQALTAQLTQALSGIAKDQGGDVVVAYEPVWAIGSGHPASAEEARDAHQYIRATVTTLWGQHVGERLPILYGGSITPENLGAFLAIHEIDGALIGGACLDPAKFATLITLAQIHS